MQISAALLRSLGHGAVADALAGSAALRGLPLRILLAGTATGHDSAAEWEPVVARLRRRGVDVELLGARRPLDVVAAIRRARVVIGTSLHVRVVAASYGVARVSLARRKVTAYAAAWDDAMPAGVELRSLDSAVAAALAAAERPAVREHSEALARRAHDGLLGLADEVRRLVETETEADRAARLELRVRDQAALLAREGVAQRAELARLRREVERLSVPRGAPSRRARGARLAFRPPRSREGRSPLGRLGVGRLDSAGSGASPTQNLGPGPRAAARSPGLARRQRLSERQPQPMHSVRPTLSRSSSAIRASMRVDHVLLSRDQSRFVGARSGGSFASSAAISSSVRPTRWAKTTNAIRRSTDRG